MQVFDGHGRLLRPTEDGLWVGATFLYVPPLWRELGLPGVVLVEPLRVQLAFGETPAGGEREVARIRQRYVAANARDTTAPRRQG